MIYVLIAAALIAGGASFIGWVEHQAANAARTERDAATKLAALRATETGQWKAAVADVQRRCSEAAAKAVQEAEARDGAASKALEAARKAGEGWRGQAEAARAARAGPPAPGAACPAGEAVRRAREAL